MGKITSGTGLISGINTTDIINQLMALEERPKTLIQNRKDTLTAHQKAYAAIGTQISTLTTAARSFQRATTFTATAAKSSDEDVLTATTTPGSAVGSYQFTVARLVTSQQSVSAGYTSADAPVKAGTISIEMGGGDLGTLTNLSQLNGGAGVRRGLFRISDRAGKSAVIDIAGTVTLDDVVKKINTALDIGVKASVKGDKLVLADTTGSALADLTVQDLADGFAAADLGILGTTSGNTLTGSDINSLGAMVGLATLNDGRGVRRNATGGADLVVTARDGSTKNITLGAAVTSVGDAIKAINDASGGKFTASIVPGANRITITDKTGGGGTLSVANAAGSNAATDLGLAKNGTGATLSGNSVLAGLNSVLVRSLNGGTGLTLGTISIKDRSGNEQDVNLAGSVSVADILDKINAAADVDVTASLNAAGNGIQIVDDSGGTGSLVIDESGGGTTAEQLGLKGSFDTNTPIARGKNLQVAWLGENTLLTTMNGGKGVTPGSFKITNSAGGQSTVDLTDGKAKTLGEVVAKINLAGGGVTASINANGDGLLITDNGAGPGKMKIENLAGTTAKDLGIVGEAKTAAGPIDGSFEKTIEVTATDTLTTVSQKIKDLGFGGTAAVINDGSGVAPHRLSLTAFNSGRAGRLSFDAGTTGLDTRSLVDAQDAAVFVGGGTAAEPLLVTSSTNQLTNIVPGVNIELQGVSTKPVTLNVTRDPDSLVEAVGKFVTGFNETVDGIAELTKFDPETNEKGLLLGEGAIQRVQTDLYASIQGVVTGAGRYRMLADVGITIGEGAKLVFDEEKFRKALGDDPEAVKNLFTQASTGLTGSTTLTSLNENKGVRVAGVGKPDFKMTLRDGSAFDVTVAADGTINDLITSINTVSGGKVTAQVNASGKGLKVVDNTAGATTFAITTLNGSSASTDLGIGGSFITGTAEGGNIFANVALQTGGGYGYQIERRLNLLVDPVEGVLTREKKQIDDQNSQFDKRMTALDAIIAAKRARLERQFANMETVLAGLQNQQSALASMSAA